MEGRSARAGLHPQVQLVHAQTPFMSPVNERAANPTFEFDALQEAHAYRRGLLREFSPFLGARVMEVGAGIGQFTELLARQPGVTTVLALEPDARLCAQ